MISAIVAVDENYGIGFNGSLLECIPADLKHFKELTENNIVVMGRKTQESLSDKRLPNRRNIVITNQEKDDEDENEVYYINLKDVIHLLDVAKIYSTGYDRWKSLSSDKTLPKLKDIFIIGGGSIYYQLLEYCDRIYLTKVYKHHDDIDTYFPNISQMENEWELTSADSAQEYNGIKYQFMIYDRKS